MKLSEMLLPEFDHEMANTRKTLERVPMDKADWKPHKKSMALGYLARHIATLPDWITETIQRDSWDVAPLEGEKYQVPAASSTSELLALFDKAIAGARAAIAETSDEHLLKSWSLLASGKE
ncbi:MAG TPA: DinB family protein, partial [Blastocatellia bacterium]|nr:DinB family protein [Blastocatellia bacterium]